MPVESQEGFYMLYVEGRSGPTRKHKTLLSASNEANRLALQPQNAGRNVYILEAKGAKRVEHQLPPPIVFVKIGLPALV